MPLRLPPNGSMFVVFRREIFVQAASRPEGFNDPRPESCKSSPVPWDVQFDPDKGGPAKPVRFDKLVSGRRVRSQRFSTIRAPRCIARLSTCRPAIIVGRRGALVARFGECEERGRRDDSMATCWASPGPSRSASRLTGHLRPTGNELAIEVTNLWPNRLIGDRHCRAMTDETRTNIEVHRDSPLLDSGLLGPVQLMRAEK